MSPQQKPLLFAADCSCVLCNRICRRRQAKSGLLGGFCLPTFPPAQSLSSKRPIKSADYRPATATASKASSLSRNQVMRKEGELLADTNLPALVIVGWIPAVAAREQQRMIQSPRSLSLSSSLDSPRADWPAKFNKLAG